MIAACKTGSAKRVTAVLPLFPYSRQPDAPHNKTGAPLAKPASDKPREKYTFESIPSTPGPGMPKSLGFGATSDLSRMLTRTGLASGLPSPVGDLRDGFFPKNGVTSAPSSRKHASSVTSQPSNEEDAHSLTGAFGLGTSQGFQARRGYKEWSAQPGALIADLLSTSGADHVVTLELHDAQYQGFFDCPVDNLYARPLLKRYIQTHIPDYTQAVIVSPDAGGAKRAASIADSLGMGDLALIHKERRGTLIREKGKASMMLVGDVAGRTCILVDDLVDTGNTITRAARLLQKEGAKKVYALVTHGVLSGDAIARINASALDRVVVTNSVPQDVHRGLCPKLEVLDVSPIFAEAIRRIHHGESLNVLFQHD